MHYHKWRTYDRLTIDPTIILGQMVRYFVNRSPGSLYGVGLDYIILEYRYRTVTENRYRHLTKCVISWKHYRWFELTLYLIEC